MELVELAQNNFGNTRSGSLAGPVGALLIALLAVTVVLLIRSMNTRLRRLPERFSADDRDRAPETDGNPGGQGPAGATDPGDESQNG